MKLGNLKSIKRNNHLGQDICFLFLSPSPLFSVEMVGSLPAGGSKDTGGNQGSMVYKGMTGDIRRPWANGASWWEKKQRKAVHVLRPKQECEI